MFFTGRTASIMCGKMLEVSVIDGSCRVRWVLGGKGEINVAIFLSLATLFSFRPFPSHSLFFFGLPLLLFRVKLDSFDWQEVQFLECKPEHAACTYVTPLWKCKHCTAVFNQHVQNMQRHSETAHLHANIHVACWTSEIRSQSPLWAFFFQFV